MEAEYMNMSVLEEEDEMDMEDVLPGEVVEVVLGEGEVDDVQLGEVEVVDMQPGEVEVELEEDNSVKKVFGNQKLLERILELGLLDNQCQKMSRVDLCSFRLVARPWQEAISNLLKRTTIPLYVVSMTGANSLKAAPEVVRSGKVLTNFVNMLATRPNPDSYAGFVLKMKKEVFRGENYNHLQYNLGQCGSLLLEMEIEFPTDGGSLPAVFSNFIDLPALRKFVLKHNQALGDLPDTEVVPNSTANLVFLMQSLMNHNIDGVEHLTIEGHQFPCQFQLIKLPESLSFFMLSCGKQCDILRCLGNNRLPNLSSLFVVCSDLKHWIDPRGFFYKLLSKLEPTLKAFSICDSNYDRPRISLRLRIPIMGNLKAFGLNGISLQLEDEMLSVSTVFPKLKDLWLCRHTESMLKMWTSSTPAPLVKRLTLELVDEDISDVRFILPITEEMMKRVHTTFPNITTLSLRYSGSDFEGLRYVFQEMTQMTHLHLLMEPGENDWGSNHWDAALIGVPVEELNTMVGYSLDFWDNVELEIEEPINIKLLKQLEFLELVNAHPVSLISDLTFIHGLNMMSKLKRVKLRGNVMISTEIKDRWNEQGRVIEYSAQ